MDLANMREQGVRNLIAYCLCVPAPGADRRVELSRRHVGPVVQVQGEVRKVRRAQQPD
jgi:hypothetical protein